jgi:hypothetical protein
MDQAKQITPILVHQAKSSVHHNYIKGKQTSSYRSEENICFQIDIIKVLK